MMEIPRDYDNVVIVVERARGNDTVGEMWLDTYIVDKHTTLEEAINKVGRYGADGKIIITIPKPKEDES